MRKKVVILGGSSGIGKACAARFAHEDWQVLITGLKEDELASVAATLPGTGHMTATLDSRRLTEIDSLRDLIGNTFGPVTAIVNSIGVSHSLSALDSDFSDWDDSLQVMLYGTVRILRALVPLVKTDGRLINIASIHHNRVARGSSSYGMAKAAITQLTRSLAVELAPRGILANTVAPGFVNTPMSIKENGVNELDSEWFRENYVKNEHLPLKRAGKPEEVAGVVFFLAGPDSSYMTGSVLTVDGGLTITF